MTAREIMHDAVTEKALLQSIKGEARLRGWLTFHTFDARRSDPGFPDLVLLRPPRLVFVECKVQSERKGKITDDQRAWLNALAHMPINCGVEAFVIRPADMAWFSGTLT